MNANVQWACNELISALIEGGAQGALITGLIWGLLKVFPRVNAATRHAAWFATLLIVALLPVIHFGTAVANNWKASAQVAHTFVPVGAVPEDVSTFDESLQGEISPIDAAPPIF